MRIIINPGTGPIDGRVTIYNAYRNMEALLKAAKKPGAPWRRDVDAEEDDGRFAFLVKIGDEEVSVDMPGCSLARLKGELVDAPRLYVDGSSWGWKFAVNVLRDWEKDHEGSHQRLLRRLWSLEGG